MRLCFVANAASIHTSRWLDFFIAEGHEVHLISFHEGAVPGANVHLVESRLPIRARYTLCVPQVRKLIRQIQPDVVHGHYLTSYGFTASLTGFRPLVLTAHGSDALVYPQESCFARTRVRIALRSADAITLPSEQMAEVVRSLGLRNVPIVITQYGLDMNRYQMAPAHPRRSSVISTRQHYDIYELPTLLTAMVEVARKLPQAQLIMANDGPERPALEALAKSLLIEPATQFTGVLPPHEVIELLRGASVYVSTARTDGLSVGLLEAMAVGAFPIVTDIPANRNIITQGVNGWLFPVGDHRRLAELIVATDQDPDLRERVAAANRQYVETNADRRKTLGVVAELYSSLSGAATM